MEITETIRFFTIIDNFIQIILTKKFTLKEKVVSDINMLKDLVSNNQVMPTQFMSLMTQIYGDIIDAMVSEKLTFIDEEARVWHSFSDYIRISDQQLHTILSNE